MDAAKPCFVYRLDNFSRAFALLGEAIGIMQTRPLSQLEKEGIIQRFKYTWELAWKLLKDYLEHEKVELRIITPSSVLKAAIAARIIQDGEVWLPALDARNRMSHTYDIKAFDQVIADIKAHYLAVLDALHRQMLEKAALWAAHG